MYFRITVDVRSVTHLSPATTKILGAPLQAVPKIDRQPGLMSLSTVGQPDKLKMLLSRHANIEHYVLIGRTRLYVNDVNRVSMTCVAGACVRSVHPRCLHRVLAINASNYSRQCLNEYRPY